MNKILTIVTSLTFVFLEVSAQSTGLTPCVHGKGFRGYDKNNIEYKYRPGSTTGEPTIEMIKNNRTKIKLRYDSK